MAIDRRESYRCQVPDEEPPAILRVGSKDYTAHLYEESAGGLGVVMDRPPRIKVGQTVVVASSAGCCEAKVIHITPHGDRTRIGMQRLRDVAVLDSGGLCQWLMSLRSMLVRGDSTLKMGVAAGLCVVLFYFSTQLVGETDWWNHAWHLMSSAKAKAPQAAAEADREQTLAHDFLRLDQLKSAPLVESLRLTPDQQQQISAVVEQTSAALAQLYERRQELGDEDWSLLGLQLLQVSWHRIQTIMTAEQRARWDALSGGNGPQQVGSPPEQAG